MPSSFSSPGLGLVYIRSWYQVKKEFDRLCNYPIFRGLGILRAVHQDKSSRPQYILPRNISKHLLTWRCRGKLHILKAPSLHLDAASSRLMLEEERLGGKEDVLPPQLPLFRLPMCLARLAKRISRLVSTPTNSLNTHHPNHLHCASPPANASVSGCATTSVTP